MRVLFVCDHYPPAPGGLAGQVQRTAHHAQASGHEVMVLTASQGDDAGAREPFDVREVRLTLSRLPVYQDRTMVFHPPWPDRAFRSAVDDVVRSWRPEVIHAHGWSTFSAAAAGAPRPRIISTLHDYGFLCPKKSLMRFGSLCPTGKGLACLTCDSDVQATPRRAALAAALRLGVPHLNSAIWRFVAVSAFVARQHSRLGFDPGKISIIPTLLDLDASVPDPPPLGEHYVLYAGPGSDGPHKGRHIALRAFERGERLGHRLVVVGGRDPIPDGVSSAVVDVGYQRGRALRNLFAGAALVLVPSVWPDPFPGVALEAMEVGRPVIASSVGGLPEIVDDGRTGILVPPGDVFALQSAIDSLLADPSLRAAMGAAARDRAQLFRSEVVFPRLDTLYREAANA